MFSPQVSVLLPCRNGARTLEIALRSILSQTFQDFELLYLDDGSTDDSIRIAKSFNDPRIRILGDSIGRGLPSRLNEGIVAARGLYIARMDADDVSFPSRFAKQVAFLEAHPEVDLVGCRAVVFKDSGSVIGLLPFAPDHAILCARPWRNIPLPHPTWMGRREWFQKHWYRLPEVRRAEDQELLLRACPDSRYACLDEVLLGYRQGDFQLGRTLMARQELLKAQLALFASRHEWSNALKAFVLTLLKSVLDLSAAVPGGSGLFFFRMSEPVPSDVEAELHKCLEASERPTVET